MKTKAVIRAIEKISNAIYSDKWQEIALAIISIYFVAICLI